MHGFNLLFTNTNFKASLQAAAFGKRVHCRIGSLHMDTACARPCPDREQGLPASPCQAPRARFHAAVLQVIEHQRARRARSWEHNPRHVIWGLGDTQQDDQPWIDKILGHVAHELYHGGRTINNWLTPAHTGRHWVVMSPVLISILLLAFVFQAANFPYWDVWHTWQDCVARSAQGGADCAAGPLLPTNSTGPAYLRDWLSTSSSPATTFPFPYMRAWGSLYAPDIAAGQSARLFTSQFVHMGPGHLIGNLCLLAMVGIPMERRFGWWRLALVWCVSVLGGNLWSLALEDPCTQVVGASGGVFGLVGMFASDLVLNRQQLKLPLFRLLVTLACLTVFLAVTASQDSSVSHMSHVGGLLCGLLPTWLVLPNPGLDRMQRLLPFMGALALLCMFITLPVWVFTHVLPQLQCA